MEKKPWYVALWDAFGGRKYVAVIIGTVVYLYQGEISTNYLLLLCAYMGANILKEVANGKNGKG